MEILSKGAQALHELLMKVDHVWDEKHIAQVCVGFRGVQNLHMGVLLPVTGRGELGDERENLGIEIMWQSLGFASEYLGVVVSPGSGFTVGGFILNSNVG